MTAISSQRRDCEQAAGAADSRSGRGRGRNKQQSASLPHCEPKPRRQTKSNVLTIRIYKRKGSRFWQALVKGPGLKKRITTKTELKLAAQEFAALAIGILLLQEAHIPPLEAAELCLKSLNLE